jgi:hypothetical protein
MTESPASSPEVNSQIPWGGVTDPLHHDPMHFRYLLHVDSGRSTSPDPENAGADDVWEYALDDPDRIKSLPYISASLVDETHRRLYEFTMSSYGFILEAPRSAIIGAHSMDMFSKRKKLTIDELRLAYPAPDPDKLLAETKPTDWNEVAISPNGLVIKAIFWVDGQGRDYPDIDRETVEKAALEHGLPFLKLDLIKF